MITFGKNDGPFSLAPSPPDFSSILTSASNLSNTSIITVKLGAGEEIKTAPSGPIDEYELMQVIKSSDQSQVNFTAAPNITVSRHATMEISLPEMDTSYELSFASVMTSICGGEVIRSERKTTVTRCTR